MADDGPGDRRPYPRRRGLQWLDQSANRSVGAQVKFHKEKYGYEVVKDLDSLTPDSTVEVVTLGVTR